MFCWREWTSQNEAWCVFFECAKILLFTATQFASARFIFISPEQTQHFLKVKRNWTLRRRYLLNHIIFSRRNEMYSSYLLNHIQGETSTMPSVVNLLALIVVHDIIDVPVYLFICPSVHLSTLLNFSIFGVDSIVSIG